MSGPSPTTSLRLEKQFTGENTNTWGVRVNNDLDLLDSAIAGMSTVALTGDGSLSSANYTTDQSRAAMLKFTGTLTSNVTVTIPAVTKSYLVLNSTNKTVTLTTGAGSTVTIDPTDRAAVFCDASNVLTLGFGSYDLKTYISQAVLGATGSLPAVTGNAGKFLYCDGSAWFPKAVAVTDLATYAKDILGVQVALAVAL